MRTSAEAGAPASSAIASSMDFTIAIRMRGSFDCDDDIS
jgi:hypothetical protein